MLLLAARMSSTYLTQATSCDVRVPKPASTCFLPEKAFDSSSANLVATAAEDMAPPILMPSKETTTSPSTANVVEAATSRALPNCSRVKTHHPRDHPAEPSRTLHALPRATWMCAWPVRERKDRCAHDHAVATFRTLHASKAWSTSAATREVRDKGLPHVLQCLVRQVSCPNRDSKRDPASEASNSSCPPRA